MAKLINQATIKGMLDEVEVGDTSIFTVYTSAVYIQKTADKTLWDEGELTYTIDISNVDETEPAVAITEAVFTDVIDPAIAELLTDTVMNGTTQLVPVTAPAVPVVGQFSYDADTGLLTIPLADIARDDEVRLTFRVEKKA